MIFCDKCSNLMISEKRDGKLKNVCRKCGYVSRDKNVHATNILEKIETRNDKINIILEDTTLEQYPIDKKMVCPKCDNKGAYWYMQQTRAADEPPTMFLCCTKCKHKWREY
ncbi:MAG: transcription factor S [Candidatus Aenigmarchaeota archaeon]|nr:transcription factor S [Candidatus Aenigmarchaeota archaeon]